MKVVDLTGIQGIHHVTTISGDAGRTLSFYTEVLGLRLLKKTVNFDEPSILHFYCGDPGGSPGSLITFFVHEGGQRGQCGSGYVSSVVLSVAEGSLAKWHNRLDAAGTNISGKAWAFGREYLCFTDPDGLELSLSEEWRAPRGIRKKVGSRIDLSIRGIQSIELQIEGFHFTSTFLGKLGFLQTGREGSLFRFQHGTGERPVTFDLLCTPDHRPGSPGPGLVNHVAWLVPNIDALTSIASDIAASGYDVTPPLDRQYFSAIYFRGPGGAKFAVATFGPGFAPIEDLGGLNSALSLPTWLEPQRSRIESQFRPPAAGI